MLWKYLIIYLATESCQTVSCNSSCTSRRSSFFWEVCRGGGFRVGIGRSGGWCTGVGCWLMGQCPESQCTMGRLGHVAVLWRAQLNLGHHTRGFERNCTVSRPHRLCLESRRFGSASSVKFGELGEVQMVCGSWEYGVRTSHPLRSGTSCFPNWY